MNRQQKDAIQQLREEGQSYSRIADRLGISENTIKSYCRRNSLSGIAMTASQSVTTSYCRQCGAPVNQTDGKKQKQYCSDQCRMAWWNAHPEAVNRKGVQDFSCLCCGRNFESYNKKRKYCSRICYGKSKIVCHE